MPNKSKTRSIFIAQKLKCPPCTPSSALFFRRRREKKNRRGERKKRYSLPSQKRVAKHQPINEIISSFLLELNPKERNLYLTKQCRLVPIIKCSFMDTNLSYFSYVEQHLGHGGFGACLKPAGAAAAWVTRLNVSSQIFPCCLSSSHRA